ncbi:hypothetical protein I7I53_01573 [Histoplasma capsulatum var. duboisii H88]|uniref:Uncharacterized protein n=1 Tax=Ajellomyces capsulatus (strain H88) TaxID=544711 RepID=A0A8A1LKV9_AJEC8|nr:hypothetical protein I7I53_01573 [Histoplasma capsulatum var. duboisii H88]
MHTSSFCRRSRIISSRSPTLASTRHTRQQYNMFNGAGMGFCRFPGPRHNCKQALPYTAFISRALNKPHSS